MNGGKLLKVLIFFLILLQLIGFIWQNDFLNPYVSLVLFLTIAALYFISTKQVRWLKVLVLSLFLIEELLVFYGLKNVEKYQMMIHITVYLLLFYFLYYNHKSFVYNKRDVFTLVLGSSLFTVMFIVAFYGISEPMKELQGLGFVYLLLIYVLLIVAGMHYVNIRSEKSLWFFLSMLNFAFSDFMFLIDRYYLQSIELKLFITICSSCALVFLVKYMITKSLILRSEEFEGF